jgi:hypothetical protein
VLGTFSADVRFQEVDMPHEKADSDWTRPAAMAIPKEGFSEFSNRSTFQGSSTQISGAIGF